MKQVKDIIKECNESDAVIVRDFCKAIEIKIPNVSPACKKAIAPYWKKHATDYWRDGNSIVIIIRRT